VELTSPQYPFREGGYGQEGIKEIMTNKQPRLRRSNKGQRIYIEVRCGEDGEELHSWKQRDHLRKPSDDDFQLCNGYVIIDPILIEARRAGGPDRL
jgi:hypothetical protein